MNKSIMIIDDEAFIRQSFADWFEDRQWQTLLAVSGEQALEILETESPDCAIVDIRMGGMTGDEFIRKAHRKKPDMVYAICTGSPEFSIPEDLLAFPHVYKKVLTKPLSSFLKLEEILSRLIAENQKA